LLALKKRLLSPDCRLLTIVGPGGSGKTRLALELARILIEEETAELPERRIFPDGIWHLPLSGPGPAESLVTALSDLLSFQSVSERTDHWQDLLAYLRGKRHLLILDNFEYMLVPAAIQLVTDLLNHAPGIKLLVCSRARLNAQAEQLYPLGGMEMPDKSSVEAWTDPVAEASSNAAVQLFLQSARRGRPDFELSPNNVGDVLALCRRLDGMPLAIELAGAWVDMLTPAEILIEIEENLDFLETSWLDIPERQRSLRAVFGTSWKLLTGREREAYLELSVFRGGFSRDAAQRVAGANLGVLLGLVNKSWLVRDAGSRFFSHELLRQYGHELLSLETDAWQRVNDKHTDYFARFMYQQGQRMRTAEQKTAVAAIRQEFDNVIAAWQWLVDNRQFSTLVEKMLPGLFFYCGLRYQGQIIIALLDQTLDSLLSERESEENDLNRAILLTARSAFNTNYLSLFVVDPGIAGWPLPKKMIAEAWSIAEAPGIDQDMGIWFPILATLYGWQVDSQAASGRLQALLSIYEEDGGDTWILAFTIFCFCYSFWGSPAEKATYLKRAITIFRSSGDGISLGHAQRLLGNIYIVQREYQLSIITLLEAGENLARAGDKIASIGVNVQIGDCYRALGQYDQAFAHLQIMAKHYSDLGNREMEAGALSQESMLASRYSDLDHARQTRLRSIALAEDAGDLHTLAWGKWELGEIERLDGNYDLAQTFFRDARDRFQAQENRQGLVFYHRGLGDIALDQGDYTEAEARFEQSKRMAGQETNRWPGAYALVGLGRVALAKRQYDLAKERFLASFKYNYRCADPSLCLVALIGLAAVYNESGDPEQAVFLCVLILNHPQTWRETRDQAQAVLEEATRQLPVEVAEAAQKRGLAADFEQVIDDLLS